MARYEFRSRVIEESPDDYTYNSDYREVEKVCNKWVKEGFVVFSVIQLNMPDKYQKSKVRLTARRDTEQGVTPAMFEETE